MLTVDPEVERKLKAAMSVAEMARTVGMTRARFYQLIRSGIFPPPAYSIDTRQPMYVEEQQRSILLARRRNCGIDGTPILFRNRLSTPSASPRSMRSQSSTRSSRPNIGRNACLVEPLQALGLAEVDVARIDRAVVALFPNGIENVTESDLIRRLFLHLRQSPAT